MDIAKLRDDPIFFMETQKLGKIAGLHLSIGRLRALSKIMDRDNCAGNELVKAFIGEVARNSDNAVLPREQIDELLASEMELFASKYIEESSEFET